MIKRSAIAALAILACALGLIACGGDDSEGATAEAGLSKEDYLAKADAICLDVNKRLDATKDFEKDGPAIIEQGIGDLRALPVPAGDEDTVDSMLSAAEADLEKVKSGDTQGPLFQDFHDQAEAYGLKGGCTGNGG